MLACTPAPHTFACLLVAYTAYADAGAQPQLLPWRVYKRIEYVKRVLVLSTNGLFVCGEVARAWRL